MYCQFLFDDIQKCERCDLALLQCNRKLGKIPGAGSDKVKILILGICPGDRLKIKNHHYAGSPFNLFLKELNVEGQIDSVPSIKSMMEEYVKAMDLPKDNFYISNITKCSTLNNQIPDNFQIRQCFCWLQQEIELVKPEIIICLGRKVSELFSLDLLQVKEKVSGMLVSLYHPAALIRGDKDKMMLIMKDNFKVIHDFALGDNL